MILSRGRRYLFVHIPKTGGTALALALEARAMADDILIGDTPKARRRKGRLRGVKTAGRLWKHSTVAEAEGLYRREELDGLFVFTLVRNPWDRMVSYYHWLRDQRFDHPAVTLARQEEFAGFLNHPATRAALRANPYGAAMRDGAGRERADLFVRLECLGTDLAPLAVHLGFDPTPGRANESRRPRDWRGFYSDGDAALVAQLCAEDVARFGYIFDPPGVSGG
ncbi:sulfotransferase family 2 domain-containing protein [Histidinibacterium lentulum]|uniref:Type II secretory pathway, pullulanase PulA n=1 Tax=Histidinibacterium lentulum TaxID=2480588 RepID=A0A3N2R816_9RHOB|nr:sulfotransferase family 2 domain-containing protein [Histidinibacterium lentulum]ROU03558.1 Type II secretory pathway, pullulanase PulA [Histidinibacterium lentulum]